MYRRKEKKKRNRFEAVIKSFLHMTRMQRQRIRTYMSHLVKFESPVLYFYMYEFKFPQI